MNLKDKKWIRFRIRLLGVFFVLALGAVLVRAYYLQVIEKDRLIDIAKAGYERIVELPPERGAIYDRNREPLALSIQVASVYAHPHKIEEKVRTARVLAKRLDLDFNSLLRRLESRQRFVWIERKIPREKARKIEELGLKGVATATETGRYYPGKEIAGHLIGFSGIDNQGLEGLEFQYDHLLRGPKRSLIQIRDGLSRPFSVSVPGRKGRELRHLVLTIDKRIQYKTERTLAAALEKTGGKRGHCLIIEPDSGEILSMAVAPGFNPNAFAAYSPERWRNRVITDCYEPGSTMKAFLLASAFEEWAVTPQTLFDCEEGSYRIGNHVINDSHERGILPVSDIIIHSSNIGAVKIGYTLGYHKFYNHLKGFGFGKKTGVPLPGERSGFVRIPEQSGMIERANLFFGQGMSTTSLQLATAMAALANGGKLMEPHLVKCILDKRGNVLEKREPELIRRVISEETAAKVTEILEGVVSDKGTGPRAAIKGFRVAGKTGTAQKVDPGTGRYSSSKYVSIFVGFAPSNAPRIALLVMIDEPRGTPYGGIVAAPVFREIAKWTLNYLGVSPRVKLAKKTSEQASEVRRYQRPKPREQKGVESVPGAVPNFKGMGMREVLKKGRAMGLRVVLKGSGLAVNQTPMPGSSCRRGKTIKVTFRPPSS